MTQTNNFVKISHLSDIKTGDRLFYELGYYSDLNQTRWIREGIFKEIENPINFISQNVDMDNSEYIQHHNFVIIKKEYHEKITTNNLSM